ncbi:MAG: DNA-3-methyladenine glycosylase [Acidimicrobiales bacterium]
MWPWPGGLRPAAPARPPWPSSCSASAAAWPWTGSGSATPGPEPAPLGSTFYRRDPRLVAPELLNKVLMRHGRAGRIVEVEAYTGATDPASHAFRGQTPRNATMFGRPGLLYVYRSYGVHWCANAVCGDDGEAVAVLLRALAPTAGVEDMRLTRLAARRDRDLCCGPGRLTQALGITGDDDGADLTTGDRGIVIIDDGLAPPVAPAISARIGLTVAMDRPWRWFVAGDPNVSRRRPSYPG